MSGDLDDRGGRHRCRRLGRVRSGDRPGRGDRSEAYRVRAPCRPRRRRPHTLAANMDVVAVVHGLRPRFNPRRMERELVLAHQSGATALVVLTKTDLVPAEETRRAVSEARAAAPGVEVIDVSNRTGAGIDHLSRVLAPGLTFALLGASGVGKSSLVNRIAGRHVVLEGTTRAGDDKGRHTTTSARLIVLDGGRLVLDTPGVRALALWEAWEGLAATFAEIDRAEQGCRFADCLHESEPHCAVRDAVDQGRIDPARLASWHRLREEMDQLDTRLEDRRRRTADR
ncbi:MAG: ribosome small subunit-dependent GTPase A [Microthrixaceae bacterium]